MSTGPTPVASVPPVETEAQRVARLAKMKVEEGTARAKKAFEDGQRPGDQGRADDGVPSAEDNARVNDKIKAAGLAADHSVPSNVSGQPAHLVGENETAAVVRSRAEQHAKQDKVLKTDPNTRRGFNPNDHTVKRPGDPGVAVHIAPSAPPVVRAAADTTAADAAARARAVEAERLAAEARARGEG